MRINKHDYSSKEVILLQDLGVVNGKRKGVYACNVCGTPTIKFTANANKGSCRCQQCGKIKPLKQLPLKLIEDLGMMFSTPTSKRKVRMCQVECPICQEGYKTVAGDVASGKSCMCRKCSLSFSGWSDSEWEKRGKASSNFDSFKVYVIKLFGSNGEEFYKIGKTYTTVKSRYSRESSEFPYTIEILFEYSNESGIVISKLERLLLSKCKTDKYVPLEKFCGKTECISAIDIDIVKNIIKKETE